MHRYANRSGDSGVVAYGLGPGWITVEFAEGHVYLYDQGKPGAAAVGEMQRLAQAGRGLSSYISRAVRQNYAKRLR
ncbi:MULTISPECIES: hypothetical protein [unclassified Roseateles]|uniref:hypothetical protein n=1 Tax=unclassified Roseateles TaxID=2626991 RepID=UPI0006F7DFAB|nr:MULTISPECIES: hypothetical protein [unclassified Roseateles]KQW45544.1 hypothetical protein ASC81_11615 [Pelomonas sp. Root405]KRA72388.1 hypothetical protein ASD88_11615 [Pelomonas sp. Root662]